MVVRGEKSMEELVGYLKANINSLADELLEIPKVREFLEKDMEETEESLAKLTKKRGKEGS